MVNRLGLQFLPSYQQLHKIQGQRNREYGCHFFSVDTNPGALQLLYVEVEPGHDLMSHLLLEVVM